ncbi:serine/threonine-protein phosphatase 4 regulatory subunit 4-like isoform X1 [Hydractinia symbiolongicarpus]|uniref:serine/threonine-protein phosphatase 4 regulatory subunit 4-like isoform X1 n=1 Tax=Hydractinia symbiolongicarpus TaxID=13093 RepID=UPI00254C6D0E|nr:serine/threonine-protein phosphatase 4 regulatory subunit 4-like isoform X1 [Hydractinia symbiolongicarpus]
MAWESAFCQQMLELALSEEDVEELRSERSIKHNKVTNEEIEQLTIDESLPLYERTVFILSSGQDVQKVSAIGSLYDVLLEEKDALRIFPLIESVIPSTVKDIQLATAHVLLKMLNNKLLTAEELSSMFLAYILDNLGSKDKELSDVWLELLLALLDSYSNKNINEQVLQFLVSNGSLTRCSLTRKICCQLVSYLAKCFDKKRVQLNLIPSMKALCQDIELEVRSCMCSQLDEMADNVDEEITEEFILPELCLLIQDEEATVRLAALSTITSLFSKVKSELLVNSDLISLTQKFYRKALPRKSFTDLLTCAKFIGKVMYYLKDHLAREDMTFYLDCYQVLCCQSVTDKKTNLDSSKLDTMQPTAVENDWDSECRYWCAFNFPAVLSSIPSEWFKQHLLPSFLHLMKDNHPAVRKAMACSLHEVLKLLTQDVHLTYNALKLCLTDTDIEVLHGVLSGLPATLECLHQSSSRQNYVLDLIPSLCTCEQTIAKSLRWRTHELYFRSIRDLHKYVTSDHIYYKFVPLLLYNLTASKVRPVKHAAGCTLLEFIKYNRSIDERKEICTRLITDLARSPSSRSRLLFLDICHFSTHFFSKRFFKDTFYDVVMDLAVDPIANVRIKFCELLPVLKAQIRLPYDRFLLQIHDQTVRRIMALEVDADVSVAIRRAIIKLDSVRLSTEGMVATDEDVIDQQREKEENEIMEECSRHKEVESGHQLKHRSQSVTERMEPLIRKPRQSGSFSFKELPKKGTTKSKESSLTKISSPSNSGSKISSKKSSSHTTAQQRRTPK